MNTDDALFERHYSVAELAEAWNLSKDTIIRMFLNQPGVLVLEQKRKGARRRHRTLRIPKSVAELVHKEHSGQ